MDTFPIAGKKVLEFGCGVGRWSKLIMSLGGEYFGVDISPKMVEIARTLNPTAKFFVYDGKQLNFPDKYFDVTFTVTVLHHIPYDIKENAIKEICRVTKYYIIIVEDICFKKPDLTFNMFPLSVDEWISLFEKYNFKPKKVYKHKLLQGYLLLLTKRCSLTNSEMFKTLWTCLEKVAQKVAPWRWFAGCCIVFKRFKRIE